MPPGYPLVARGCFPSFGCLGLFSGEICRLNASPPVTSAPTYYYPTPQSPLSCHYGIPAALLLDELALEPGKVLDSMTESIATQDSGTLNVEVNEKCHFLLPAHISI